MVLVDSLPLIGGQMVHSLIGLFCGIFGNAPEYRQLTHGVFDDIFRALGSSGDLYFSRGHTTTVFYNEVALGRWLEKTVRDLGIQVVTGAVLQDVVMRDGRVVSAGLATRYGNLRVRADGFVDASGDAALTWQAGLPCWVPERPIYGSQQVIVENLSEEHKPEPGEVDAVLAARGEEFGLLRRGGLAFFFPGRGTAVLNVTHIDAPLDPWTPRGRCSRGGTRRTTRSRCCAPSSRRRSARRGCGPTGSPGGGRPGGSAGCTSFPWMRSGRVPRFRRRGPDGVADRAARPVGRLRLGDVRRRPRALRAAAVDDPAVVANLVAAGRCVDGDAAALSSVRVMGPCSAMGAAAAHALDLAAASGPDGSVHDIDLGRLRSRLAANLGDDG